MTLAGCGGASAPVEEDAIEEVPENASEAEEVVDETVTEDAEPQEEATNEAGLLAIESADVIVPSDSREYESYLAAPTEGGPYPAIVLIHSFRGLEEGYRTMTDNFAAEGFVVLAVGWQTFEQSPSDQTMTVLLEDSISYLTARADVDSNALGLTGFCAGGRYTMRFLPTIDAFGAGVAWYGFPNSGDPAPIEFIEQLDDPMLIIHGTDDRPSPIEDIYTYTEALDGVGAEYTLEVYEDEPHGFMLEGGQLRTDEVATDAYNKMVNYFKDNL